MFSKSCEYGIKAALYIASRSLDKNRVKIGDIVAQTDSPEAFTAKILGVLSRCGIVDSYTGPNGGYEISHHNIHNTTIADIVRAIDGNQFFEGCVLGLSHCDESQPCLLHHTVKEIREEMRDVLQATTIYDLATSIESKEALLMR